MDRGIAYCRHRVRLKRRAPHAEKITLRELYGELLCDVCMRSPASNISRLSLASMRICAYRHPIDARNGCPLPRRDREGNFSRTPSSAKGEPPARLPVARPRQFSTSERSARYPRLRIRSCKSGFLADDERVSGYGQLIRPSRSIHFQLFRSERSHCSAECIICVWVTTAARRPSPRVILVCQTIVSFPLCTSVHSACAISPAGTDAMKFVLLSMVIVFAPSGSLAIVATVPSVVASAITAPPEATPDRLQSSGLIFARATARSGITSMISRPISVANGSDSPTSIVPLPIILNSDLH